jgi:hypothetical protein
LTQLNGKPLPDLQFGITPNAIITILSTIAKGCLLVPVQSAMGQLKWIQAAQVRPLDGFWVYDEASRGAKGSFDMLVRRKGGYVLLSHPCNIFFTVDSPAREASKTRCPTRKKLMHSEYQVGEFLQASLPNHGSKGSLLPAHDLHLTLDRTISSLGAIIMKYRSVLRRAFSSHQSTHQLMFLPMAQTAR